jgi:sigma-B regulation protein RsbU (phosphoserine phosphatase)
VLAYVLIGNIHPYYTNLGALSFVQTLSNILIVAMENHKMTRQRLAEGSYAQRDPDRPRSAVHAFSEELPNDKDVAIHASYIPHSTIGGDYYDYIIDRRRSVPGLHCRRFGKRRAGFFADV